jgi:hypothetical protein
MSKQTSAAPAAPQAVPPEVEFLGLDEKECCLELRQRPLRHQR